MAVGNARPSRSASTGGGSDYFDFDFAHVSWSPAENTILFAASVINRGAPDYNHFILITSTLVGNLELVLATAEYGNDAYALGAVHALAWSPDGSRIALHGETRQGRGERSLGEFVLTMASDGSDVRFLAHEGKEERLVAAAPVPAGPLDPGVCSAGTAVEAPGANPGLVADCEALVAARDTLAGGATLRWGEGPVSGWEGVTVEGSRPRVRELDLRGYTLMGQIPAELGQLSELRRLDLSDNLLDGAIPYALGSLSNLRTLSLAGNLLGRSIPRTFGELTELRELFLARNRLTGGQWEIVGLPHLMVVGLDANKFLCMPPALMDVLESGFLEYEC